MTNKALTGTEAAVALADHAAAADRRGLSWSLDPTIPGGAEWFRLTVEGVETSVVVRLMADGTWSLAK